MKILLVEDSRILRERLRIMIADIPNTDLVAETDNEGDAFRLLETHRPDIAILDIRLRTGSGLSVLEYIKANYPETVIMVLTNYGHTEYRSKCAELALNDVTDRDIAQTDLFADLNAIAPAFPCANDLLAQFVLRRRL